MSREFQDFLLLITIKYYDTGELAIGVE